MTGSLDAADFGSDLKPKASGYFPGDTHRVTNKWRPRVVQFRLGHHSDPTWASQCSHPHVCVEEKRFPWGGPVLSRSRLRRVPKLVGVPGGVWQNGSVVWGGSLCLRFILIPGGEFHPPGGGLGRHRSRPDLRAED